jgi:broad specificity phosphatase PhoE
MVRHGRTPFNASRRILGRSDVPLDDVGRRQAAALGRVEVLSNASRVVCSPLVRARDTAAALGPEVCIDDRWTELDFGVYDGASIDEVPALWDKWSADITHAPRGGESPASVGERVRQACEELWPEAEKTDVVVVTHVSPIKAAVAWALGVGDETSWRMFVDVASLTRIGAGRDGPALRSFNETHFLVNI